MTTTLDVVVRRLLKKEDLGAGETLVRLDAKSGRVLLKDPGFLDAFRVQLQYFAVSTDAAAQCPGIHYRLLNGITIKTSYEATCPNGNEHTVVQSLHTNDATPEAALNEKIRNWIKEFASLHQPNQILDLGDSLQTYIASRAREETGLALRPECTIRQSNELEPQPLASEGFFTVRVIDHDNPLNLRFESEIIVSDKQRALAQPLKLASFKKQFIDRIKQHLIANVSLHQFCYQLNKQVRADLLRIINEIIEPAGRHLGFLTLQSGDLKHLIPEETVFRVEETVLVKIQGYEEPVPVINRVILELEDLATYLAQPERQVPAWLVRQINDIVSKELLNATYKDILLHRQEYIDRIRVKIKQKAEPLGFSVSQHVVLPDLKEYKLVTEGFTVNFAREFETRDSEVKVKLNVYAIGRLDEEGLQRLEPRFLNEKSDVFAEIGNAVGRWLDELIRQHHSEEMLLKFTVPADNERMSVQHELENVIKERLEGVFQAIPSSILVTLTHHPENEIIEKARILLSKIYSFQFKHFPKLGEGESMDFEFVYKIEGVLYAGWTKFQQKTYNVPLETLLSDIQSLLESKIAFVFDGVPYEQLLTTDPNDKREMEKTIQSVAFNFVGNEYGLKLGLLSIQRKQTESEKQDVLTFSEKYKTQGESERKYLTEEGEKDFETLRKLKESLRTYLETGETDEAAAVEAQIRDLESKLGVNKYDHIRQARQAHLSDGKQQRFSHEKFRIGLAKDKEDDKD